MCSLRPMLIFSRLNLLHIDQKHITKHWVFGWEWGAIFTEKQQTNLVARSSAEVEHCAMKLTCEIRHLLCEIKLATTVRLWCHNQATMHISS